MPASPHHAFAEAAATGGAHARGFLLLLCAIALELLQLDIMLMLQSFLLLAMFALD